MFNKILVANRGEIAVRVMRACRELGIPTVAVYSEVDRESLHVQTADEAVCIGPAAPLQSYLNADAIIRAVRKTGADAIHPGYGFLSENHLFTQRCEDEGIVFIGPDSKALKLVGDKVASRETMMQAGVPLIPGMMHRGCGADDFASEAEKIGYPVLVKASAGGGGKGMRIVRSKGELKEAMEAGMREAKSAFGDESVYIEKYIEEPRHIEFQILADKRGNAVHLFERECSIQRRHQKIVEETPSIALNDELRRRMGKIALKVVEASGYSNAGTVEFLVDREEHFYFLEVNARLQVEHPVTELVTGIDLVHQQIRIASGKELGLRQEDLEQRGHAIECRIYAEDPQNNFLPSPGKILFMQEPSGPGVRHDCGIYSGWTVPVQYDPILSKLIVWGENRDVACRRMVSALSELTILGIRTTVGFLRDIIAHPQFAAGRTYTSFIEEHMSDWTEAGKKEYVDVALAAAAISSHGQHSYVKTLNVSREQAPTPWQTVGRWEIASREQGSL
jgi:acetyl-CoA carboxylase biotin carboxylase subunit